MLNDVEVGVTGAAAQTVVEPTYYLSEMENTVQVSGTRQFAGYFSGMNMTVTGEGDFAVTYNGQSTAAVAGKVELAVTAEDRMPVQFAIAGEGTFQVAFSNAAGDMMNPDQLIEGINLAVIEEGSLGYYYIYEATETGTLTITMPEGGNWTYTASNVTAGVYGETQWSDSDPVVNPCILEVTAGDQIELIVCTYDPESSWVAPAGELTIEVIFNAVAGSEQNPIFLNEGENVLTIPAGATVYYQGRFGGKTMTAVGAGATVTHNEQTYTLSNDAISFECFQVDERDPSIFVVANTTDADITVTLTVTAPAGTQENPAQLSIGENTATVAAGTQGYYYTWTADVADVLTITMQDKNWFYTYFVAKSNGLYTYGENYWSDDAEPAISTEIAVKAGDKVTIQVNTYDPKKPYQAPAGTIHFTASVTPKVCTHANTTTITVDATCTVDGSVTVTCDDCGEVISYENILALGHDFVDGTCSVCGEKTSNDVISGTNVSVNPDAPILLDYVAQENGTLSVTVSGKPGYKLEVFDDAGNTIGLPKTSSTGVEQTLTYELVPGIYQIRIVGFADWDEAEASVTYVISFQASQSGETEKSVYEIDRDHALTVGDNSLSLLENAETTIYVFAPEELGIYTITAPAGATLGYWGAGEWFLNDPASESNTYEWTCTAVGQGAFIGISGVEGQFNVNVEKTGEYITTEIIEAVYENKAELSQFEIPEGAILGEYVDVTGAHSAVLGEDGYYHLDSADGPILLIDLNYKDIILTAVLNSERPVMNAYVNNEDGTVTKYDIIAAVQAYEKVADENGYYPLTEDLILFYENYATASGTWSYHGVTGESAWMYCMRTMTLEEPVELINWAGSNVTLGGALALNFAFDTAQLDGTTGNYIVLTRSYADGREDDVVTIPQSEWVFAGGTYIQVSYTNMAAKEMGDKITAVIYNAAGKAISETRTDSMAEYSMRMLVRADIVASAEKRTLFVDMLNYGAAAQVYFDYDAENLVNATLTEEQAGWASAAVKIDNYRQSSGCYLGSSLSLEEEIYLKVAFGVVCEEGMYATVSFTDHYGTQVEKQVPIEADGSYTIVRVEGMAIADYRGLVTCKLYSASGAELGSTIDSIESYTSRMASALQKNGVDLGDAIMKLGASSYAFFH